MFWRVESQLPRAPFTKSVKSAAPLNFPRGWNGVGREIGRYSSKAAPPAKFQAYVLLERSQRAV
jgi:hypothetical protein